jgi:hypothetical protein
MEEILSLVLYLLVITFLTLLQFSERPKRKYPKRYSCRMVDGKAEDKKYF